jgi:large subunit ribosomal protein L10
LAITREKKEDLVARYKALIQGSSALVFTNYRGTNVQKVNSLRNKLKESGNNYVVVKNRLLALALRESGRAAPEDLLSGTNGVAFIGEDIAQGVTVLNDWIKTAKVVEVTGALVENTALNAKAAEGLSNLPTKDQTRAMLLGVLSAPARNLVQIINAPGSSLARVIHAHAEPQQEAA